MVLARDIAHIQGMRTAACFSIVVVTACTQGRPDSAGGSSGSSSVTSSSSSQSQGASSGSAPACTLHDVNVAPLTPEPGELFYVQLGLGGVSPGESALVVGPDGSILAIDVGNNAHDDDVVDALDAVTTEMRASGFMNVHDRELAAIILTHHHADHVDGLEDLLGRVQVKRSIVHRGLLDVTGAANSASIEMLCRVLQAHPSTDMPLCEGNGRAPCDASRWSGTYPSTGCMGLMRGNLLASTGGGASYVPMGEARLTFLAADATVGEARYEEANGTLRATDINGENARSVVGMLELGSFRLVFAGDLTGGGSDTDPVEQFIAQRLPPALLDRGVDVLHASHHGRNTSSSNAWLEALLPGDGRPRNVVMGISTAHLRSPHAEVLDALLGGRLGDGNVFSTRVAAGGATHDGLQDARGGQVRVRTVDHGARYLVQVVHDDGTVGRTVETDSVRACR